MALALTERDISLFQILWKWKLLSTAAITSKLFSNCSPATAYSRLWWLKKSGYLRLYTNSEGQYFYWGLTQKSFAAICDRLPELKEEGFKPDNVGHDALVSAIHLGEWLMQVPASAELVTEQELRRFHSQLLPSWVSSLAHRPDGYWRVPFKDKVLILALEVELNQKKDAFYQRLASLYAEADSITRVIWIVRDRNLAKAIYSKMEKVVGPRADIHNIATLVDFQKLGWQAPFLYGAERGKTIHFLLERDQTSSKQVWTRLLLDGRKCPHKSMSYLEALGTASSNCIRLSPNSPICQVKQGEIPC